jgi:hypothetical protein
MSTTVLVIGGGVAILAVSLIVSIVVDRYQQRAGDELEQEARKSANGHGRPQPTPQKPVRKAG